VPCPTSSATTSRAAGAGHQGRSHSAAPAHADRPQRALRGPARRATRAAAIAAVPSHSGRSGSASGVPGQRSAACATSSSAWAASSKRPLPGAPGSRSAGQPTASSTPESHTAGSVASTPIGDHSPKCATDRGSVPRLAASEAAQARRVARPARRAASPGSRSQPRVPALWRPGAAAPPASARSMARVPRIRASTAA
jgi:hypothetical protein